MMLKLLDYANNSTQVDIGELDGIAVIRIEVVTGDEIAHVIYKDYSESRFDSSGDRTGDFYDGEYDIYNITEGTNNLDNEKFVNRKTSYEFLYGWD